jgi:hypothetical protein
LLPFIVFIVFGLQSQIISCIRITATNDTTGVEKASILFAFFAPWRKVKNSHDGIQNRLRIAVDVLGVLLI